MFIFFVIDLMVCVDFVLRTCAQSTVVKVEMSNHLGSRNGLIHFTLIPIGKIVSVYEHFGLRTFRFTNISVYEHFSLRTFRFTNISVYEHFSLRTFRFTNISVYEHFGLRTFRFTNISVYEHFGLRTTVRNELSS